MVRPAPDDFTVEFVSVKGLDGERLWAVVRSGIIRIAVVDERMAVGIAVELARMEKCRAWQLADGETPRLLFQVN